MRKDNRWASPCARLRVRLSARQPRDRFGSVDTSQRLRHTINFVDEVTPTSRAKPDGVQGCEIWTKVGDAPPAGPNEVHYLALDTRTPYTVEFDSGDGGKTAHYMLRWMSTRGEAGPWSQTVSATITNYQRHRSTYGSSSTPNAASRCGGDSPGGKPLPAALFFWLAPMSRITFSRGAIVPATLYLAR
jgi:hypothetical protein